MFVSLQNVMMESIIMSDYAAPQNIYLNLDNAIFIH